MEQAVLVTGASTGIGRAIALHLDSLGFRVFAGVRKTEDGLRLAEQASPRFLPLRLDITDQDQVSRAAAEITEALGEGGLHGLVCNAGIAVAAPVEFVPLSRMREQFEVNVFGHVSVIQAFLPLLRETKGRIVLTSSLGGRLAQPMLSPYCASKHALEAIGDALRLELKPWGMEVSLIEPGAVRTPIWDKGASAAQRMMNEMPKDVLQLYGVAIKTVRALAAREGERGINPHKVAVATAHALTSAHPKTRYVIGRDAQIGIMLRNMLPDRMRDRMMMRMFKITSSSHRTAVASEAETRPAGSRVPSKL